MDRCIPVEELARVLDLPADQPERRHLESCARCQSLAALLRDFESSAARPGEARFEAVDPALRASVARLTGVSDAAEPARPVRERRAASWFAPWTWRPAFQFAGGLAVFAVMTAAVIFVRTPGPSPDVMRAAPGSGTAFVAEAPLVHPGEVELRWSAVPGASAYRVVLLGDGLREVGSLAPTAETHAVIRAGALPAGLASGTSLAWQVEALAGADRLGVTPARTLRLP